MSRCVNFKEGIGVSKRFSEFLKECSGKLHQRMLEVGCGYGIASTYTYGIAHDLTLIDVDFHAVDYNERKWHSNDNVHVHLMTINETTGSFDAIYYFLSLHHINNVSSELVAVKEKLSEDGLLFICEMYSPSGAIYHHKEYSPHDGFTPNELSKILSDLGFDIIATKYLGTAQRRNDDFLFYAIMSKQQKNHTKSVKQDPSAKSQNFFVLPNIFE